MLKQLENIFLESVWCNLSNETRSSNYLPFSSSYPRLSFLLCFPLVKCWCISCMKLNKVLPMTIDFKWSDKRFFPSKRLITVMCVLVHLSYWRIPYERLNGLILGFPISYDIKGRDNGLKSFNLCQFCWKWIFAHTWYTKTCQIFS